MADFAAAGSVSSAEPGYKFVPFTSLLTNRQVSLSDPVVLAMNQMDRQKVELPFLEGFTLPRIQYGMPSTSNIEGEIGKGIDDLIAKFPLPDDFGDIMAVAVAAILKALPDELVSPDDAGLAISSLVSGEVDKLSIPDFGSLFQNEVIELLNAVPDMPTEQDFRNFIDESLEDRLDSFSAAIETWLENNKISDILRSFIDEREVLELAFNAVHINIWRPIGYNLYMLPQSYHTPRQLSRGINDRGSAWLVIPFRRNWRNVIGNPCRELHGEKYIKIYTSASKMTKYILCKTEPHLDSLMVWIGDMIYGFYINELTAPPSEDTILGQLAMIVSDIYKRILDNIDNIIASIVPGLLGSGLDDYVLNHLKDLAGRIGKEMNEQIVNLENTVGGATKFIGDEFEKQLDALLQILPSIGDQIGRAIADYLNQIMRDPAVQTQSVSIGEAIGEKIGEIFHNEVLPLLRGSGTAIGATIANLLEELWDTHIEPQIDEINEVFDGLQIRIDNLTGDVTDWIKDALFKPVLAPIRNVTEDGFEIYTKGDGKETRYIAFSGSSDFDLPGEGFLSGLRERLANRSTMDG